MKSSATKKRKARPAVAGAKTSSAVARPPGDGNGFPIVGIGASAGGLEAVGELLAALPPDSGMAFVVVQHLSPKFESRLSEILARRSKIPVEQVESDVTVAPDRAYVIPPNKNMVLSDGRLQLAPRTEQQGQHRPIDPFLRSLAEELGYRAIGVILSGTANDGTLGLQEIKAAGGITFAQDDSAQQTSMPRSAVASGCVDYVLPPAEIARELGRIGRHPYVRAAVPDAGTALTEQGFARILELLRRGCGVDFSNYKRSTLQRRIARRMVLHKSEGVAEYIKLLESSAIETEALYQDVLINVTSFFRNPEAFDALKAQVFPRLTYDRAAQDGLRAWTLGCSTGEEAYSIAMAYAEFCDESGRRVPLQIFATDLNGAGIEKARSGFFGKGSVQDVSLERLGRFFVEADGGYRVAKPIRDVCVFARQNALADPPFSRVDLIACRNLLIYLEPVLQQRLLAMLHYALRPDGCLWLGHSETIGAHRDLFEIEDARHKIYRRKAAVTAPAPVLAHHRAPRAAGRLQQVVRERNAPDPQRAADRVLLSRYAPPGVLLGPDLEVLQFRGDTGAYLAPAPGRASLNLLKMLREGLLVPVRGAIEKVRREGVAVREEGLKVRVDGSHREVAIQVMPVPADEVPEGCLLLLFEEPARNQEARARRAEADARAAEVRADRQPSAAEADREEARLRQELVATREYLQSVIEQQEAANEELQSANEEVQSANEELQSVNEELETSKEELQSSSEELATVNDELQNANRQLTASNEDFVNLLNSVQLPIVIFGPDLRVRRLTPAAEKLLQLSAGDVGRPIDHLRLGIDVPRLRERVAEVIDRVAPFQMDVPDKSGRWHSLRVHPYRTLDNRIDGAVLVLVDIDAIKRAEQSLRESEARFHALADSAPVLIWVLGAEGMEFVNRSYIDFVGAPESQLRGYDWTRFIEAEDRDAYVDQFLESFGKRAPFEGLCRMRRADGEFRWMKSVGLPRFVESGEFAGYVGSSVDVSDVKQAEIAMAESDRGKSEFLAVLAHELRNPLAAVRNALHVIGNAEVSAGDAGNAREVIDRQTRNMVRMVDDLLDVTRISHGSIHLRKEPVELVALLRHAVAAIRPELDARAQQLELAVPGEPAYVLGDPTRLEQIVGNLLNNSSKFTPNGGHIWVALERELQPGGAGTVGMAAITVRDDGIGIAPQLLKGVFGMFTQAERSVERTRSGLGVGLALTSKLVELHGGSIDAHSEGLAHGSQFVVRLPLTGGSSPPLRLAGPVAMRRILVVDDNIDGVQTMAMLLRLVGHEVEIAYDGVSALGKVHSFKPEVVLLDIGLPDMDGYQVARRLREAPGLGGLFLVALTGFGQDADVERARSAGFDEHVTKPLDPEMLHEMIGRLPPRRG